SGFALAVALARRGDDHPFPATLLDRRKLAVVGQYRSHTHHVHTRAVLNERAAVGDVEQVKVPFSREGLRLKPATTVLLVAEVGDGCRCQHIGWLQGELL